MLVKLLKTRKIYIKSPSFLLIFKDREKERQPQLKVEKEDETS